MSDDLTKKAVKMLLNGATLLSEPCPYCKGVRVMKDGHALCVNCGKEPEASMRPESETLTSYTTPKTENTLSILEQKLQNLSKELDEEKDHEKQHQILKSINSLIEIIDKLKKR
ncbi:MAG: Sjogren's syndrome/scleroderma autoantigen 1 family protein [Nitrosopumilaceae archaeon]